MTSRKPYPSDVSDEAWAFVAPYLTLMTEGAPQRRHELREVFNGLRSIVTTGVQWRWLPHDLPPHAAVDQQARRWLAAGCFEADRARPAGHPAAGRRAYADQGYTGEQPAAAAAAHGIQLGVVQHPEGTHGFVLWLRRWVVERSFAWTTRFRRLVRDDERLTTTLAGFHCVAFAVLMLQRVVPVVEVHNRL